MKKANNLLKISSIIYILIGLLTIYFSEATSAIFLSLGLYLLSLGFLPLDELHNKKTEIILIAIISILINLPSAVMLFIVNDEISAIRKNNNLSPPKEKISDEVKRIDLVLKIGISMVFLAGILIATTSWQVITDIIKCILLVFIGIIFIFLSKFSEKRLKLENTTKIYYIIGLLFFLLSFIGIGTYGTISPWFSYTGTGKNLVYFITLILLTIILFIINKKFNQKEYKYLGILVSYFSLYHILVFIGLSMPLIMLVVTSITLIVNILPKESNNEISNISEIISYLYWPLILMEEDNSQNIVIIITLLLNMINILLLMKRKQNNLESVLSTILIYILILGLSSRVEINNQTLILVIVTSIFYILINHKEINTTKHVNYTNQVIYNIIMTIKIIGIGDSTKLLICGLIYGLFNLISCYITNKENAKFDKYYQPMIIFIVLNSIFSKIDDIINIEYIYVFGVASLIYILIHYFIKEKKLSKLYFILSIIISIITLLYNLFEYNLIIALILIIISSLIHNKNRNSIFAYTFLLISILYIEDPLVKINLPVVIANIIIIITYIALTYLNRNKKSFKRVNLIAITLPLLSIINSVDLNYSIKTIVSNILWLYILYIVVTEYIKSKKAKDIIATIFTSLIILTILFESDLLIGLYIGIVSIGLIFITYNKDEYKGLFYTGVIITILNILNKISEFWTKIPLSIYLLVAGGLIILFATLKELKKEDTPKEEINGKNGDELIIAENIDIKEPINEEVKVEEIKHIEKMNFCPHCGMKNENGNFCKKCGISLIKK